MATWGIEPGGVERHIRSLDEIATKLSYHHDVLAAWARPSWAGAVSACSTEAPPRTWRSQLLDAASLLKAELPQRDADVLLLHGLAPVMAARRDGRRRIAVNYYPGGRERRINWAEGTRRSILDRPRESALDLYERMLLRRVHATVVLSAHGASLLRTLGPDPIVIPPHCSATPGSAAPGDIDVLIVRRLAPRMGHAQVLREIADGVQASRLSVVVAGTGPLEGELKRLVSGDARLRPHVRFVGALDSATLRQLYSESRVVLVPSSGGEGFGLTALEALACGTLPLVSDVPSLRDLVAPISPQLIAGPGRWPEALAHLLTLTDVDRRALLQASRARLDSFSLERVSEQWASILTAR